MYITDDIKYIGVNDHDIDLFEGQYIVENGMAYNSYLILDEKVAVMDTVDGRFVRKWLDDLDTALAGRRPDYLIVQHMEPDHSAGICAFRQTYPDAVIVASAKALTMMKNYFCSDFSDKVLPVDDGDTLELGQHTLVFRTAPMVHWPEVIVTYDSYAKVLFSADAFGKFGALDVEEEWVCEARRYYFGIVGKYGVQVQNLLKKLEGVPLEKICPLHGPVLDSNLSYYIGLYDTWSSYEPESAGITIAYTSVYGHTKEAVLKLKKALLAAGCPKVAVHDLARTDMAEAVEDAFRYDTVVFATTTYNAHIFPPMREFIHELLERNFCKRTVAFVENGSWTPTATKVMKSMLEGCRDLRYAENTVRIISALNEESEGALLELAKELCANYK